MNFLYQVDQESPATGNILRGSPVTPPPARQQQRSFHMIFLSGAPPLSFQVSVAPLRCLSIFHPSFIPTLSGGWWFCYTCTIPVLYRVNMRDIR